MSQCCKKVRDSGRWMDYHQCRRAGKVERDGKSFCGIHDPVAVKARSDKWDAAWKAKRAAERAREDEAARQKVRADLCVAACEGLTDDEVRAMIKPRRTESFLLETHEYDEPSKG